MKIIRPVFDATTLEINRPPVVRELDLHLLFHNELMERGPRMVVEMMSPDKARGRSAEALIDTGADITAFEEETIRHLGYEPHDIVNVQTATGREQRGLFWIYVSIPQRGREHKVLRVEVAGLGKFNHGALPFGLIGRDVLRQGSLSYDGPKGVYQLDLMPDLAHQLRDELRTTHDLGRRMTYLVIGNQGDVLETVDGSMHKMTEAVASDFPGWSFVFDGNMPEEQQISARRSNPVKKSILSQDVFDENLASTLKRVTGLSAIDHDKVVRMSEEEAIRRLRKWLPNGKGYDTFRSAARHLMAENYKTSKALSGVSCWNPWKGRMDTFQPAISRGLSLLPAYGLLGGPEIPISAQARMVEAQRMGHPALQARSGVPAWNPLRIQTSASFTICPKATKECISTCLVYTGHNDIGYKHRDVKGNPQFFPISANQIVKARRTEAFLAEPIAFMKLLHASIEWHSNWCKKKGVRCFVRLNVLSDIPWEVFYPELLQGWGHDVIFYDYTKIGGRSSLSINQPGDFPYHLTYSYGGGLASKSSAEIEISRGTPVAIVFFLGGDNAFLRSEMGKKVPFGKTEQWQGLSLGGYPIYDGDCHDLRPLDPSEALIVGLQYKQPVMSFQRLENPKKSGFIVYAESAKVSWRGKEMDVWTIPASGRQLGADDFVETDPDSE